MKIAAFTYIGTQRKTQQDAVLVNGNVLTDGIIVLDNQDIATCFVADGVAGSSDGAFASQYVLNEVKAIQFDKDWMLNVRDLLNINQRLLKHNSKNGTNSATTLAGVIYYGKKLQIFQAGDCEIYLLRGKHFIPLAPVHNESVENIKRKYPGISTEQAYEKAANTITSFYGSQVPQLRFDKDWQRRLALPAINSIQSKDKILICSDGLFKSISKKEFTNLIESTSDRTDYLKKLLEKSKQNGAIDNVSMVLIEIE